LWSNDIPIVNEHPKDFKKLARSGPIIIAGGEISRDIIHDELATIRCDNDLPFFIVNKILETSK
jgi:hypothetical protein